MNILLQGRVDIFEKIGGDSTLLAGLAKELKKKKIHCDIYNPQKTDLSKFDIVHFFGIMRIHDLYPYFLQAKKQQKKIVVTPIYEDLRFLDEFGRIGWEKIASGLVPTDFKELAKGLLRGIRDIRQLKLALLQFKTSYSKQQKDLLTSADHIMATSKGEMSDLIRNFALSKSKFSVIPICIKKGNHQVSKDLFVNKYGLTNFILSVGRIEPKKNQLNLLKALKDTGIQVLFIGSTSSYHKSYVNTFFKQLKTVPNAKYLGYLDKEMLLFAYAAAKVHVLPSWFEVMGITSMEAAINGCNVVTTNKGYAREYFKDFAWYCDPQDDKSIRKAVINAYNSPFKTELKEKILKEYTWDKITPKILEVYKEVLK